MSWVCLSLDPIGSLCKGKPASLYLAFVLNFTSVSSNANPSAKTPVGYGFLDGVGGPWSGSLTGASKPFGDGCGLLMRASSGASFGASEPNGSFIDASFHDGP